MHETEPPIVPQNEQEITPIDTPKSAFEELLPYFPEASKQSTAEETSAALSDNEARDRVIEQQDISEMLRAYGLNAVGIEIISDGRIRIPVTKHFDEVTRLPEGYGYKGGAARALLLRSLGKDDTSQPRDIDVVRMVEQEPYPGADTEVSEGYMPEDFKHGDGVEKISDQDKYFTTRDLTMNEVIATDKEIIATPECLRDTARGILRLTEFARKRFNGEPGAKMLSRILRFYSDSISENMPLTIADKIDEKIQRSSIPPFWIALQLDRSLEKGPFEGERLVQTLRAYNQIPDTIQNPTEAVAYLNTLLQESDFYFRYTSQDQLDVEDLWVSEYYKKYSDLSEKYDKLPTSRGHGKS